MASFAVCWRSGSCCAGSCRAGAAIDELFYLDDTIAIPAVQTIIDLFDGVELKPNNRDALVAAADAIEIAPRSFIAGSDGTELAAVDPLWDPHTEPAVSGAPVDESCGLRHPGRVATLPISTPDNQAGARGADGGWRSRAGCIGGQNESGISLRALK